MAEGRRIQLKEGPEGIGLSVLVRPRATRDRLCGEHGGRLKIALTAPPEKGKANEALRKLLAARLGVSRSQVRIIAGHSSRLKEVFIERVSPDALDAIIA